MDNIATTVCMATEDHNASEFIWLSSSYMVNYMHAHTQANNYDIKNIVNAIEIKYN